MKSPATIIATVALAIALGGNATVYKINEDQQAAARQSHEAICLLRDDVQKRFDNNQEFLRMTVEERVRVYGKALGHIDPQVIQKSLVDQAATLNALNVAKC